MARDGDPVDSPRHVLTRAPLRSGALARMPPSRPKVYTSVRPFVRRGRMVRGYARRRPIV
ncbi:MAG: hypothetical protein ACM31O_03715 [Bacteroidota bacterium]